MLPDSHHSKTRIKEFEKVVHFGDTVQVNYTCVPLETSMWGGRYRHTCVPFGGILGGIYVYPFGGILRSSKYVHPLEGLHVLVPHFIHISLNITAMDMVGQLCVVCVVTSMTPPPPPPAVCGIYSSMHDYMG